MHHPVTTVMGWTQQPMVEEAVWVPRPGGMAAFDQRDLRRAMAGSGSGVPEAWTKASGCGCPEWWHRLAYDSAWAWRLMPTPRPLVVGIEAYAVASIPTPRWAEVLRREVAKEVLENPEAWTDMHAGAWDAALEDGVEKPATPYAWLGDAPLMLAEGRGGAPWSWLHRSRDLVWDVIAASKHRAWIRFTGTVWLVNSLEEGWLAEDFSVRRRKDQRQAEREEAAHKPTPQWVIEYPQKICKLRAKGEELWQAHATLAWAAGDRWVRQPGDPNYYGEPSCRGCDRDGLCGLCRYAQCHNKTPAELIDPPMSWEAISKEERFGSPAWEAGMLELCGLLDTAKDPEGWPGTEELEDDEGGPAGDEEMDGEDDQQQQIQIFDGDDGESSDDEPAGCWGAPGPVDPAWETEN